MFTGIIETIGEITKIEKDATNKHFYIKSSISNELKIDQSIAHNGCCLTVVDLMPNVHKVTAISESLKLTNLGQLQVGNKLNLERCVKVGDRFDGHFVQGHVDTSATCKSIVNENGSWRFYFSLNHPTTEVLISKGSVTINGVSLTLVDADPDHFSVAIIPYTYDHTVFKYLNVNDLVNIEFDMLGKYVQKLLKRS